MNSKNNNPSTRSYRQGLVAAGLTVGIPVVAAVVLPGALAIPLALVAPFVGMTTLEALLDHEGLLPRQASA